MLAFVVVSFLTYQNHVSCSCLFIGFDVRLCSFIVLFVRFLSCFFMLFDFDMCRDCLLNAMDVFARSLMFVHVLVDTANINILI